MEGPAPPPFLKSGFEFSKFSQRKRFRFFSKGEVELFFSECFVSMCVFCLFTLYTEVIFENQRQCGNLWHQQLFIQWNTNSCREYITGDFNIYLCQWVSLLALLCVVYHCLCMWYQIRVLPKYLIMCQASVNLIPCCM